MEGREVNSRLSFVQEMPLSNMVTVAVELAVLSVLAWTFLVPRS